MINTVHSFVNMNQNGYRDFRETVTQAWLRLGLLEPKEQFTRQKYAACVQDAVENLKAEGFITSKVADFYLQQAATRPLPSK